MKTVCYWQNLPEEAFWTCFEGDKRHWDECLINMGKKHEEEILAEVYDETGAFLPKQITRAEAEKLVREGAFLIACGFAM